MPWSVTAHVLALIESGRNGNGSTLDPDMELEEWYNWEIVGVATEADIQKEINKEITIADIQKGIEKRRNKKVDLRNTRNNWKVGAWKQQESRSAEAQIH